MLKKRVFVLSHVDDVYVLHVVPGVELVGIGLALGREPELETTQIGNAHALRVLDQIGNGGSEFRVHREDVGTPLTSPRSTFGRLQSKNSKKK